ncbi:MAG: YkgJ family cysteine cluster protein [Crenarchaeota archaeon]|nr:YkgJ family cysteine cluster protein [Thermoproteota archaeon]MCR8455612.1 YkgJ family cysteine cluster protein [Thermoproteota archaeon]MCR8501438.1 YkgJ family cysteine cluster protein [Thermoproteota archaeon]
MSLLDGTICTSNKCFDCCLETEMPLTIDDIKRIVRLGYEPEHFMEFNNGLWRLKNVNGKCVFLNERGLCEIHKHKPVGCRLYPIIEVDGTCTVDFEYCKFAYAITEEEIKKLCRYVVALNKLLDALRKDPMYRELRFLR